MGATCTLGTDLADLGPCLSVVLDVAPGLSVWGVPGALVFECRVLSRRASMPPRSHGDHYPTPRPRAAKKPLH